MLSRLEIMMLMTGMDLPPTAIREQIASAVDIIVQITRFSCGSRKVASICEVTGTETAPSSCRTPHALQEAVLTERVAETGISIERSVSGQRR